MTLKRQGFTLVEMLIVIIVVAVLALVFIPRLFPQHQEDSPAAQLETADESGKSIRAYDQAGKMLAATGHQNLISDGNWLQLAKGHGYVIDPDPRKHGGLGQGDLHFLSAADRAKQAKSPAKTIWAYEIYKYQGETLPGHKNSPCLFGTCVWGTGEGKNLQLHFAPGLAVLFADGHAELVERDKLDAIGLDWPNDDLLIWTSGSSGKEWLTYNDYLKEHAKR